MDNTMDRICHQCGKKLSGRLDKKFCDDYCRSTFNNQFKREDQQLIQEVNRLIRKNRRILKSLCPIGKATVRKEVLDTMEYDYRYFSGLFKTSTNLYYLVYDYAFAPIYEKNIEKALIVKRQEYMDRLSFEVWRKKG